MFVRLQTEFDSDTHVCERVALPHSIVIVGPAPPQSAQTSELGGVCCEDGGKSDFAERAELIRRQRIPCEETVVCAVFHNLFLKPGKAFSPSPYSNCMLTSKMPVKEYAMSPTLVVCRCAIQLICCAMLSSSNCVLSQSTSALMP